MRMKRKKAKMKNEKEKRMRRNDFGDGSMFDRYPLDWGSTKRKKEMIEEEGGVLWKKEKVKEIQGGKRSRRIDQRKGDQRGEE